MVTLFLTFMVWFFGCESPPEQIISAEEAVIISKSISNDFSLADYFTENAELQAKVDSIFDSISDTDRISQMIMTSGGNQGKSLNEVKGLIRDGIVGGVIMLGGTADGFAGMIDDLSSVAQSNGKLSLIFSTDAEPSLINNKISGLNPYPKTSELKTPEDAYKTGANIAEEIWAIGFDYNFAPVCDISLNQEIIGNRSFGSDVKTASELSGAFIRGTQINNVIATAKHFPGHGNVSGDSHTKLVVINGEMVELDVFSSAIDNGVVSVMIGHIAVNNNNYSTNGKPSTISRKIVNDLLRQEMNFNGIIITDGMNMGALKNFPNASLEAVKAGCDIILMEPNERKLHSQILELIGKDEFYKQQVYESVKRILKAKVCLGLI